MVPLMPRIPQLAWGYGKTPIFKDRVYSLLAIAWGPMIQLVMFRELHEAGDETAIMIDGHYFLPPSHIHMDEFDSQIESMHFLDESLLCVTTNKGDIRVLYTQKFQMQEFKEPKYLQEVFMDRMSSLQKVTKSGLKLTEEQNQVERETRAVLDSKLCSSMHGDRTE